MNKNRPLLRSYYKCLLILTVSLIVFACGGGGGGDGGGNTSDHGLITITDPTSDSMTTTDCNEIYLSGDAFISKTWSRCCSYTAEDTGVTVTWENKTSGASGRTEQSVDYCGFLGHTYLCDHTWSVTIPLVLGDNSITITASDPGGVTGHDYITVKKSVLSYSISGKVTTTSGRAIWNPWDFSCQDRWHCQGVKLTLQGTDSTFHAFTDKDGNYSHSCVKNGSYILTPSSDFNFAFTPANREVAVSSADVTSQDFVTEAYFISGKVTFINHTGIKDAYVKLSGTYSLDFFTDAGGYYIFAIPNGSYTITPVWFCRDTWTCYNNFLPTSREITVNYADITVEDFVLSP